MPSGPMQVSDCSDSPLGWRRDECLAVAVIREARFGEEIKEYLRRIDDTLTPY